MIPNCFLRISQHDEMFRSVDLVLQYTNFENKKLRTLEMDIYLSPFVGQYIINFWRRWSSCYLALQTDYYGNTLPQSLLEKLLDEQAVTIRFSLLLMKLVI